MRTPEYGRRCKCRDQDGRELGGHCPTRAASSDTVIVPESMIRRACSARRSPARARRSARLTRSVDSSNASSGVSARILAASASKAARSPSLSPLPPSATAEALFKAASGGATLHQPRHSALTHDAEDGASTL